MNDLTPDAAAMQIAQSVAALKLELGALTTDLAALRERLKAGKEQAGITAQLQDVTQWITIAQEMEHRFETDSKPSKRGHARHAELDLDAARADIGRKLDRLRAAGRAESLS